MWYYHKLQEPVWCDLVNLSSALTTSVSMTLKKKKKKSAPEEKYNINLLFLFCGKCSRKGLTRLFNQAL